MLVARDGFCLQSSDSRTEQIDERKTLKKYQSLGLNHFFPCYFLLYLPINIQKIEQKSWNHFQIIIVIHIFQFSEIEFDLICCLALQIWIKVA